MLRMLALVATALAMMLSPSHAQAVANKLLKDFGFLGTWSPDCTKPPGPGNSRRTTWADAQGFVRFKEDIGKEYMPNQYLVLSAKSVGPDRIEIRIELNQERTLDLTVVKESDRIRTVDNVGLDGTVAVKDGLVVSIDKPTPWLNRCK